MLKLHNGETEKRTIAIKMLNKQLNLHLFRQKNSMARAPFEYREIRSIRRCLDAILNPPFWNALLLLSTHVKRRFDNVKIQRLLLAIIEPTNNRTGRNYKQRYNCFKKKIFLRVF